jgi:hypothetical protein
MKVRAREAVIGVVGYRILRLALRRYFGKGGLMAAGKKLGVVALLGAVFGALMFWRKRKTRESDA